MEPQRQGWTLVIGVGNEMRGDDKLGLIAARSIQKKTFLDVHVVEHSGEGGSLFEILGQEERVFLIDALAPRHSSGEIHIINVHARPIPSSMFGFSSHAFGVAQAIELGRRLGKLPHTFRLFGITGYSFGVGDPLSVPVVEALPFLVRAVEQEVQLFESERYHYTKGDMS
ncbi:MAG TPA: hydrogenase maturation protease [Bacteroidota bacterium]